MKTKTATSIPDRVHIDARKYFRVSTSKNYVVRPTEMPVELSNRIRLPSQFGQFWFV